MRPEKSYLVKEAADYLTRSEYVFLADYQGINAEETSDLRKKLAERGAEFHVVKNYVVYVVKQLAIDMSLTTPKRFLNDSQTTPN